VLPTTVSCRARTFLRLARASPRPPAALENSSAPNNAARVAVPALITSRQRGTILPVAAHASHSAILWLHPDQLELAKAVAREAHLDVIGVGSPARGQAGGLANAFDCKVIEDLRAELATQIAAGELRTADLLWLLSPGDLAIDPAGQDAKALIAAHTAGIRILSSEPLPATALDLGAGLWSSDQTSAGLASAVRFFPLARYSETFRAAAEVLESLGPVRTAWVEFWSGPRECSLGAALFAAMDLLHAVMGEPGAIDASYVGVAARTGGPVQPGETLRELHGDLTANLRFSDGRAAALVLSDQAGGWSRSVTLIGQGGRVRLFDEGFEWIGADGQTIDEHRTPARAPAQAQAAGSDLFSGRPKATRAVSTIAAGLVRLADVSIPGAPPAELLPVLAMAQAALLSARTGQAESPATVRRMAGAG